MTTNRMPGTASSTASSLSSSLMPAIRVKKEEEEGEGEGEEEPPLAPAVSVKKEEEDGAEESPRVVTSSSAETAAVSITSTRIRRPKKEEQDEAGGCHRRDRVLRGMKKEEDTEDDPQNSIRVATVPSSSSSLPSSMVPDHICRNSSLNKSSNCSDTYWRTGDWCWVEEDEDPTNDEEEEADAENSVESNTGPATVVTSLAVGVKKEEQDVMTPRPPLQIVARSKATDPTRPDRITLRPRRTKYSDYTNNPTEIASRTPSTAAAVFPDPIVRTNRNTNHNDDDTNDAVEGDVVAAAVGINTGTNEKRKSNHYSRDHLKRKKSKSSVQATNKNNSTITNSDDNDMNDRMYGDDDDNDKYYDNNDDDDDYESENENLNDDDSENSVAVMTDTTMNKLDERWNEMYIRLIAYNNTYQSTCVPSRCEDDPGLGNWVRRQRQLYNKNELAKDRINRLNSIGFVWIFLDPSWNEMYERLIEYKKENKSICVPRLYQADPQLGRWVSYQRTYYNTNKFHLAADRLAQLDSIGFVWNVLDANWTELYERLVAYKEQYGSTCVPTRYEIDRQLGAWVNNQRKFYNTNKLYLTADRITQLDSIGFVWNVLDAKWMEMYERLVAYKEQYGSTCVPTRSEIDRQLGAWVNNQRFNYNNKRLSADRTNVLNSIGFVWKVK